MTQLSYTPSLPAAWQSFLGPLSSLQSALAFVSQDHASRMAAGGAATLPYDAAHCFRAFETVSPEQCRCVIIGQDPYPNANHAIGYSFSVPQGVALPKSLKNIFKEYESDLGVAPPAHGDLSHWAAQGVLLANTALTVVEGQAGIHTKMKVWEAFTQAWVSKLGEDPAPRVWVLWGNPARKLKRFIAPHHVVVESEHPSPLAAYRGFFGSRPFSKVNAALAEMGHTPIQW